MDIEAQTAKELEEKQSMEYIQKMLAEENKPLQQQQVQQPVNQQPQVQQSEELDKVELISSVLEKIGEDIGNMSSRKVFSSKSPEELKTMLAKEPEELKATFGQLMKEKKEADKITQEENKKKREERKKNIPEKKKPELSPEEEKNKEEERLNREAALKIQRELTREFFAENEKRREEDEKNQQASLDFIRKEQAKWDMEDRMLRQPKQDPQPSKEEPEEEFQWEEFESKAPKKEEIDPKKMCKAVFEKIGASEFFQWSTTFDSMADITTEEDYRKAIQGIKDIPMCTNRSWNNKLQFVSDYVLNQPGVKDSKDMTEWFSNVYNKAIFAEYCLDILDGVTKDLTASQEKLSADSSKPEKEPQKEDNSYVEHLQELGKSTLEESSQELSSAMNNILADAMQGIEDEFKNFFAKENEEEPEEQVKEETPKEEQPKQEIKEQPKEEPIK